ncbi:pyridoxine-pyridoxal-pyridoxamine kinase [Schizosaccharomyces octosporus yFS286]|uniref:pyridoxal kinase n=1 Tax=Schizosaccharomyces octosporus (strain yFS286) TaxID=483514 RepID=S9R5L4_SCHOY|nr:pyridoxine-pyridoxal-pyridoxamine kinase [Schizosaccharomyces octosporus yFS286]EPX73585.1 pyridoxine-pyridoxal-pyridoxamine kinase [Schizosaccharomyces octosporus yFS286]
MSVSEVAKRVLSIQSSVCHGYVGNRAATFPLQLHEWEVDVVPTVHFSNHLGYGSTRGRACEPSEVQELLEALLDKNDFVYDAILTGFIPNQGVLEVVSKLLIEYQSRHPHVKWIADPVMGDQGETYVEEDVLNTYKNVLSHAFLITPNAFEVNLLTGVSVMNKSTALYGLKRIYDLYKVPQAVITSFEDAGDSYSIYCMGYSLQEGKIRSFLYSYPSLSGIFTGTGDLFSGLTLAKYVDEELRQKEKASKNILNEVSDSDFFAEVIGQVLSCMRSVLIRTKEHTLQRLKLDSSIEKDMFLLSNASELRLVQSKDDLLSKENIYTPEKWNGLERNI